jgi:N-acetylglucosamine repressor
MKTDFRKQDTVSEQVNILKIINRYGKITRRQIVELTGFSQAKISILINVLKKSNLIDEVNEIESSGGRKAKLLQIQGEKGRIVGLEIGGFEVKLSLTDFAGSLLATAKMPAPNKIDDPARVVESLAAFIRESLATNGVDRRKVKGMGIALSGTVNRATGECVYFRNRKSWENLPLRSMLEAACDLPCTLDDSSRMAALAERSHGCCKDTDSFILISIGVGTGSGVFMDGELFRGTDGYGGELGHMVIKENGPRCVCGNHGCLESFISGYAIERQLREALADNVYSSLMDLKAITTREIVAHAENGDKLAYSIIAEAGTHLGIGIANIINIFNPRKVVLAGGVARAGKLLLDPVIQVVRASALGFSGRVCQIELSALDEYAASRGAAQDWFTSQLDGPRATELILS